MTTTGQSGSTHGAVVTAPAPRSCGALALVLAGAAALIVPAERSAAQTTDASKAPTLTVERYDEDWSILADPEARTNRWTEDAKYVPLDGSGSVYLTTGLEARSRYEGYRNTD